MARQKTTITIATGKGPRDIQAYTWSDLPGLAIHRDVKHVPETGAVKLYSNGWMVTHIHSGMSVTNNCYMSRLAGARAWALGLCDFADWTHNKGQVNAQIKGRIRAMLSHAQEKAEQAGEAF